MVYGTTICRAAKGDLDEYRAISLAFSQSEDKIAVNAGRCEQIVSAIVTISV
jgi:hypothetical protein